MADNAVVAFSDDRESHEAGAMVAVRLETAATKAVEHQSVAVAAQRYEAVTATAIDRHLRCPTIANNQIAGTR